MAFNDKIGNRMKEFYEKIPKTKLMRRVPVVIRIDGKAFHTFTRGFKKPFDEILTNAMHDTMKYLCENVQGCVLGYTQSDEITLVLQDYKTFETGAWFDYEVQKVVSVSASMATMMFNKAFKELIDFHMETSILEKDFSPENQEYIKNLRKAQEKGAMFDSRCFNLPREEVTNMLYWRQIDAIRNSIHMLGRSMFSHKELDGKNSKQVMNMVLSKGVNWEEDVPIKWQRGACCIRDEEGHWIIDEEIPVFKDDGREYIESLINFA